MKGRNTSPAFQMSSWMVLPLGYTNLKTQLALFPHKKGKVANSLQCYLVSATPSQMDLDDFGRYTWPRCWNLVTAMKPDCSST